jgi:hypothetical protein
MADPLPTLPPAYKASTGPMKHRIVVEPRFRWEIAWVGVAVLGTIGMLALGLSEEPAKVAPKTVGSSSKKRSQKGGR